MKIISPILKVLSTFLNLFVVGRINRKPCVTPPPPPLTVSGPLSPPKGSVAHHIRPTCVKGLNTERQMHVERILQTLNQVG